MINSSTCHVVCVCVIIMLITVVEVVFFTVFISESNLRYNYFIGELSELNRFAIIVQRLDGLMSPVSSNPIRRSLSSVDRNSIVEDF